MSELNFYTQITIISFIAGLTTIFISIFFVFYLKRKWLPYVENIVDDGYYCFSTNIFSAGLGVSRYALIFLFDWHAKRCNRFEVRDKVPKKIQRLFIIQQLLVVVGGILFFGSGMFIEG